MGNDPWMKQYIARNYSTPEQRGKATALFIKVELLVYLAIMLGISAFLIRAFL